MWIVKNTNCQESWTSCLFTQHVQSGCPLKLGTIVEPRFNEVAGDRPNLFVKWRVRYIEYLDITNLRGNDQNVRYIEVIVNDWFVTQVTSVTQFSTIFVTQKCRVLRCNSLSMVAFSINYFHFWADGQLLFTKERHFRSSDLIELIRDKQDRAWKKL